MSKASSEVAVVEGLVIGERADGRRYYSEEGRRRLVQMCRQPGASVSAIALAHSMNANVLRKWMSRCEEPPAKGANRATLLPVVLQAERAEDLPVTAHSNALPERKQDGHLELELAGARLTVRGAVSAEIIRAVVAALR